EGTLRIKLFNMVMNELGYGFLEKGIIVNSRDLFDCIKNQSIEFWQGCKEILINGKTIEPDLFHNGLYSLKGDFVFLSVIVNT
ncbi:MAG: hypothetical protein SVR08_15680, partial [Spirochaetota bacterium]|nr:hypothetical protein [Spirochaetota bacterium]